MEWRLRWIRGIDGVDNVQSDEIVNSVATPIDNAHRHVCHTGAPGLSHFAAVLSAHHGIALQAASFERLNGAEFGADLCELGAQTGFNVGAIRQSNSPPSALNGPPPN